MTVGDEGLAERLPFVTTERTPSPPQYYRSMFFFSSRRRHTRSTRDGVQTCALPIYEFGKIDILINNAATLDHAAQIPNQSYELWDRDVKVNLTGAFNCTREVWPYMVENGWGRLIFMSSLAGTLGGFAQASYS